MKQILVYGDSLSWGIIPDTRQRHPFHVRWPGVLELELCADGEAVRVIEDCLNGRRTLWEDPFKPGRNGLQGLAQRIEIHSPLALVILMLGGNDFQSMHPHNAWHSAQGTATLVDAIRTAPIEPGLPQPPILILCPPAIGTPRGTIAPKFAGGDRKYVGLPTELKAVADLKQCAYFDTNSVISASPVDGVHLDAETQLTLGKALAPIVRPLLAGGH